MADVAKWYVIHTYSGYENKVMTNLEKIVENRKLHDLIEDIKVPTEKVVEVRDNKSKEIERKVFPGYVLVKMVMTDESWYVVRNVRGVTGFVGPSSKPVALTDDEVANLGVEGDNVKIMDGPLEGYIGVVEEISKEKKKVRVIVSMFGRETPIELYLDQVRPLE